MGCFRANSSWLFLAGCRWTAHGSANWNFRFSSCAGCVIILRWVLILQLKKSSARLGRESDWSVYHGMCWDYVWLWWHSPTSSGSSWLPELHIPPCPWLGDGVDLMFWDWSPKSNKLLELLRLEATIRIIGNCRLVAHSQRNNLRTGSCQSTTGKSDKIVSSKHRSQCLFWNKYKSCLLMSLCEQCKKKWPDVAKDNKGKEVWKKNPE